MKLAKKILRWIEYLSLAGVIGMLGMMLFGKFKYDHLKIFLSLLSLLISVFIFLNCADDRTGKFRRVFNLIGWLAFLSGILSLLMINEMLKIEYYWGYLNMFLVMGLYASQLSVLSEGPGKQGLKKINFVLALTSFVLLELAIGGIIISFAALFILIACNSVSALALVFLTGKKTAA